jgi:hypothetical protein
MPTLNALLRAQLLGHLDGYLRVYCGNYVMNLAYIGGRNEILPL